MFLLVFGFAAPMLMSETASASSSAAATDTACEALKDIDPSSGDSCGDAEGGIDDLITLTLNLLSTVAGVIAVIMVIISGLKYSTSRGDATQIASSKKSLIYAIVGMVVVAAAQFIVKFVLVKSA